jgi:hypothetical protein
MKVGVYVGATMAYETFLAERPDAKDWIVPNYLGQPVTYGSQTFRKLVYFQHPGYKEYIKRVLKIAIQDVKADLVHFDNSSIQGIPQVFYHPLAVKHFREFLQKKYTPEVLKKRLGFSNVSYVEPPPFSATVSRIDDPLTQEWIDFRCQQLADYYKEMADYIRSLNPQTAVECNPHGLGGINTMWTQSVDFPRLIKHLDYFVTEGEATQVTEDNILLSRIRSFKMGRVNDTRLFTVAAHDKLEMAESMAFNRQGLGGLNNNEEMDGTIQYDDKVLPADEQNFVNFFHKNFERLYTNITGIADVAILHTFATMSYSSDRPYQSTFLFEQSLIQNKVPFDVIFDQQMNNLHKYKVVVLADQECLSDKQVQLLRDYVNNGGSLVATEHTSLFNEWRQRRPDFALADLLKVKAPEWVNRASLEKLLSGPLVKNEIGKGRVVYIPEVRPSVPKPAAVVMAGKYMKLPLNDAELMSAINWAAGGELSVQVKAPQTVVMEIWEKEDKPGMVLHLVNYAHGTTVSNIDVDIQIPNGKKVKSVTVLSPDAKSEKSLVFKQSGRRGTFTVPSLLIYDVVLVEVE